MNTVKYRGFEIQIEPDEISLNPRKEFDNAGTMVCFHGQYDLGDSHSFSADNIKAELAEEFCPNLANTINYWNNDGYTRLAQKYSHDKAFRMVEAKIDKIAEKIIDRKAIVLPLYLYDHSGLTMRTGAPGWESNRFGFIYISREKAAIEWSDHPEFGTIEQRAIRCMEGEVQVYDYYLTGQVYGYMTKPVIANKKINDDDSCWGFFGGDHELSGLLECAKDAINGAIASYKKTAVAAALEDRRRRREMAAFMKNCWAY
ncbi:MAG: hypothetical protein JEZ11_03860 [Desulfobacterales bacterium]|nr:hypothetical protein [Desulfobacterales bacterium]